MKLQTNIPLSPQTDLIDYESEVLLLGSCFTENIGSKLAYFKFRNQQNPFGIIFHPEAIEKLIARAILRTKFSESDVFQLQDRWHCFEVHSLISTTDRNDYLEQLNTRLEVLNTAIKKASHIIITFGTAWGYRHHRQDTIVANCHKIPQQEFSKELASVQTISNSIDHILTLIRTLNAKASILFTVSPVRHLKDGFVENMRSKAHLITAVHNAMVHDHRSHYFAAFEIMMDELRDYRFYDEDLLHPSKLAIDIIWERFSTVWIDSETKEIQKQIEAIQVGMEHRPFFPDSEAHHQFLIELQKKKDAIVARLPHISF